MIRDIGAPGGDGFAIASGRGSINRVKERQAMRRRIRVAVTLRRLDAWEMQPKSAAVEPAE